MFIHNINPTLVQLGPLEIRWYGLVYVLSFFLMVWWMQWLHKRGKFSLDKEQTWDLAFYLTLGVLIGARLFEIFWEPSYYLGNPLRLLRIWEGGMSFHGGFVGAIVACYWWCKRHKIQFYTIADAASAPLMLGLAFGRIANFINGELVGRVFDGNWCVVFPGFEECRHPSTLYAAAKRFAIFGWLAFLTLKNKYTPGFIFWNLVFWEGLGRFIVDFYREDLLHYGLSLGQWFSGIMVVVAIMVLLKHYRKDLKRVF